MKAPKTLLLISLLSALFLTACGDDDRGEYRRHRRHNSEAPSQEASALVAGGLEARDRS
jgi:hypothetical protein